MLHYGAGLTGLAPYEYGHVRIELDRTRRCSMLPQ